MLQITSGFVRTYSALVYTALLYNHVVQLQSESLPGILQDSSRMFPDVLFFTDMFCHA